MSRAGRLGFALLTLFVACLAGIVLASPAAAFGSPAPKSAPDILGCKVAPTPEMPGRGMVGFFEKKPTELPPDADPFAINSTTTIYEQYGYAGLRWNTYDLGCGPDLARAPDASVGTAVANWMFNLPKAGVAATGAILSAAFTPDFLSVLDPLVERVVGGLQYAVFEQWFPLVLGALGLLLVWKARKASLASSASAVGWAILVMVLVTMVFRWPLVAGDAADTTVSGTLSAVSSKLNGQDEATGNAGTTATAGMHEALLYKAWLGGTFGDAESDTAQRWGPIIFDSQALTWRQAQVVETDPEAGQKIIEAKKAQFVNAAAQIESSDPDAYEYLTGRRSDSRVGYSLLAGMAALCAIPFLLIAGLLVLGALIIVRLGVMLFPAVATLGLFPTMRTLVTGIGSTIVAALINAIVFGIGASVTVLGLGVFLNPALPAWLQVILMLLLTIVMWVALSPFRRLTQMVSNSAPVTGTAGGVGTATRGAARTSGRIITGAISTFLGTAAAQRLTENDEEQTRRPGQVPQRAEASASYVPLANDDYAPTGELRGRLRPALASSATGPPGALSAPGATGALASSTVSRPMQISSPSVTVVARDRADDLDPDEIYTPGARRPSPIGSRSESHGSAPVRPVGGNLRPAGDNARPGRFESGGSGADDDLEVARGPRRRPLVQRGEAATANDQWREELEKQQDGGMDELTEVFRPDPQRART